MRFAHGSSKLTDCSVVAGLDAVVPHALGEGPEVVGGRHLDVDATEAERGQPRRPAPRLFQVFIAMWWW